MRPCILFCIMIITGDVHLSRIDVLRIMTLVAWILLIIAIIFIIGPGNLIASYNSLTPVGIKNFMLSFGILSVIVFILICTFRPIVFLPVTPFTLASGFLFGIWWGILISLVGTTLSAVFTFAVSRFLFHDYVKNKVVNKYPAIEKLLEGRGWKFVAIVRLVPMIPFDAVGYISGASKIRFRSYFIGSVIGELPGAIVLVMLGSSLFDIGSTTFYVSLILALIIILAPAVFKKFWYRTE